ncbi:peptidoglycan editing factor PgeF [bacterium 210820-DFI.6.37]|nr:peptidoglycan editing factor PgeF [bacterium 210820-DFI.6.37]
MKQLYLEIFSEFSGVKGFFSTKYGACKGSPYYHEAVFEKQGLAGMQRICPEQVHKNHIQVIREKGDGPVTLPGTDGMITNVPGVLLTTVHADCLPVWFFDPEKKAIGLVHAGWRGTAAGIAPKAARLMMENYGSKAGDIYAYIGPGISKCCFETGPEVYEEFRTAWDFTSGMAKKQGEKYYIDLKGINQRQLKDAGLWPDKIGVSGHCTCCEPELFCSYRREGGTYLRMGAGLCLL